MRSRTVAAFLFAITVCAQQKTAERPIRRSVRGTRGAVTGGTDFATEAGMRMFHTGGNAVDAGVAATFAGAVTEYSHFGFGGEAPILVRTKDGAVYSIAGIGTMPKAATADFFRTRKLRPGEVFIMEPNGLRGFLPAGGVMPALVPGMPEAAMVALREFGTKSLAEAMQPAIDLADGVPLDEQRASSIFRSRQFFELWPTSKRVFVPGPRTLMPGDVFRQPDLARTMRGMVAAEAKARVAGGSRQTGIDAARDYFYRGEIARKIAAFVRESNGLLSYEDMASFRLQPEAAVSTTYLGYTVHKPGFWSQGPVLLQVLNMLEPQDLRLLRHNSAEYLHTLVECLKLAYADRDTYYGDPKFVRIPMERLLSKQYAADRRKLVGPRSSVEFRPGSPEGKTGGHPSEETMVQVRIDDALMAADTTTINAIDRDGMMFAETPSGSWLPSVIAGDTGIPLTQRAQSFLLVPGHPNEIAGGKRPRVTLSPTIVTRDGRPYLAVSTPGGDNQDQAMLQILINVIDFGMDAQEAVEAARFQTRHLVSSFDNHAMGRNELLLDERIIQPVLQELNNRGHKASQASKWNNGSAPTVIRILPTGVIEAGADPYGHRTAAAW
jgi:gamma-glutamyltranspeptidase/glutathione hydrolase